MYESPIHKRTPRAGSMAVKQAAVRTLSPPTKMKNKRKTQVGGYRVVSGYFWTPIKVIPHTRHMLCLNRV